MDLQDLALSLAGSGLAAQFRTTDGEEHVDVTVSLDDLDEPVTVQIAPVDVIGPGLGDLEMVQLFAAVPRELNSDELAETINSLVAVNEHVPLGAFSVLENPPVVYLRHVLLLPPTDQAKRIVAEAVWLVHYGLDMHVATLIPI